MPLRTICLALALFGFIPAGFCASLLKEGDLVAVCGDSITEQNGYSLFIDQYLTMCQPTKVRVMQFGLSGETVPGFASRMQDEVLIFKPTFVTTCYGMNDGRYSPIDEEIRKDYRDWLTRVVDTFVQSGARVLIGSPGAVDTATFSLSNVTADGYNANLAALGEEAKAIAKAKRQHFADVHTPMMQVMQAAKEKLGDSYPVAGRDGIHPGKNGHLVMAHAFLMGMGFDGHIGTITVNLGSNIAAAEGDHRIVKVDDGEVIVESKRYPFCFVGEQKAESAAEIVRFFSFHQDLNRLMLKVNAPAGRYRVTWGQSSKEYTEDELHAGVNIASDFVRNPFSDAFARVQAKLKAKQQFEARIAGELIRPFEDPRESEHDEAIDRRIAALKKQHTEIATAARDAVKPVVHTIRIEPIQ